MVTVSVPVPDLLGVQSQETISCVVTVSAPDILAIAAPDGLTVNVTVPSPAIAAGDESAPTDTIECVTVVFSPEFSLSAVPGAILCLVVIPTPDLESDQPQQGGNYYRMIPEVLTPILDVRVSEIRFGIGRVQEVIDI